MKIASREKEQNKRPDNIPCDIDLLTNGLTACNSEWQILLLLTRDDDMDSPIVIEDLVVA